MRRGFSRVPRPKQFYLTRFINGIGRKVIRWTGAKDSLEWYVPPFSIGQHGPPPEPPQIIDKLCSTKEIGMLDVSVLGCCGVKEISGLSSYRSMSAAVRNVHSLFVSKADKSYGCAFILFTQAGSNATYGERLKAFVLKHKLGTISESDSRTNPNSGNKVIVYTWGLDHAAIEEWANEDRKLRAKKVAATKALKAKEKGKTGLEGAAIQIGR